MQAVARRPYLSFARHAPIVRAGVGQATAAARGFAQKCAAPRRSRKVRAPQGKAPGNAWGTRVHGKCNRKQTAEAAGRFKAVPQLARVKRCGKSAPRAWQQARHGKPRLEQGQIGGHAGRVRPSGTRGPRGPPGRLLEVHGDVHPRGMVAHDRTRLTGRLPLSFGLSARIRALLARFLLSHDIMDKKAVVSL
jgi:hypothetical protein